MKARRAFWALKGIIRLQALIRGHLARRQAVATLCSMLGIVKFQALIRGRRVRTSDIGLEVQQKCSLSTPLVNIHEPFFFILLSFPPERVRIMTSLCEIAQEWRLYADKKPFKL